MDVEMRQLVLWAAPYAFYTETGTSKEQIVAFLQRLKHPSVDQDSYLIRKAKRFPIVQHMQKVEAEGRPLHQRVINLLIESSLDTPDEGWPEPLRPPTYDPPPPPGLTVAEVQEAAAEKQATSTRPMIRGIYKPTIHKPTRAEIRKRLQNHTSCWLALQFNNRHGHLKSNSADYWAALAAEIESRKVDGKLPTDDAPKHPSEDETLKDEAPKDQNGFLDGKKIVGYERQSCGGKGQVIMVPICENQVADEA